MLRHLRMWEFLYCEAVGADASSVDSSTASGSGLIDSMCESCVTVCVVEDDPDVCESLDAVICSLGHSCRVFFNAEDLVAELDSLTWQCLIIDVDLPGMNGVELLKLLRGRNIDTPAVFYTARINDDVRLATERWSGVSVLEKGQGASPIQRYLENTLVD